MKKIIKSLSSIEKLSHKLTEKLLANTKLETQIRLAKVILPHYYSKNFVSGRNY
ncbi:MAG: hypothetical protein KBG21_05150 [Ignavibacteria bacterium]|nr:hypothetical protein [Ignavibacteria bacterium]